jgi:hypothetical protein
MFLFHCPCCSGHYLLPASAAGQTFVCPMTSVRFRLPGGLRSNFGPDQWQTCDRPRVLLSCLRLLGRPLDERRLRLLTVAVSRLGEPPASVGRWSAILAAGEHHADGLLPEPARRAAAAEADVLAGQVMFAEGQAAWPARLLPTGLRAGTLNEGELVWNLLECSAMQSGAIRELAGNPFDLHRILPQWLASNDRAVPHLAAAIYEERAFERLPILADALEDAGCADSGLLDHLRGPGPHTLGCWALDLLRGRACV